jgi:hypothetical protein
LEANPPGGRQKPWKTNRPGLRQNLGRQNNGKVGRRRRRGGGYVQANSLSEVCEGLPEFDAVAFGVGDPGEAAVVVVFAVGIDGYARGGELGEEPVEVVDAVVDHGLLGAAFVALAEVGGVFGEEGPGGHAGGGWDFVGPQESGSAVVGELEAEVLGVPGAEGFGVAGAKEDAADAGNSGHVCLLEFEQVYIESCRAFG